MKSVLDTIRREPAAVVGAVVAVLTLVVAFGVPISADQKGAIVGVVGAVLALLGAGVTRSQVTPAKRKRGEGGQAGWFPVAVVVLLVLILLAVLGVLR